jgi:hypothetical protein
MTATHARLLSLLAGPSIFDAAGALHGAASRDTFHGHPCR